MHSVVFAVLLGGALLSAPPPPSHRAFFIIFSPMLDSPDWPNAYEQYRGGIVVMNPFNASKVSDDRTPACLPRRTVHARLQPLTKLCWKLVIGALLRRSCIDHPTDSHLRVTVRRYIRTCTRTTILSLLLIFVYPLPEGRCSKGATRSAGSGANVLGHTGCAA